MAEKKRVLVVEDMESLRNWIVRRLSGCGFSVESAVNGREAWERLENGGRFDVIISDKNMPEMTGLELLTQVRGDIRTRGIPFILMSGNPQRVEEVVGTFIHTHFLPKPVDFGDLLYIINRSTQ